MCDQFLETLLRISFLKFDLNKNGVIDQSELATLLAATRARRHCARRSC